MLFHHPFEKFSGQIGSFPSKICVTINNLCSTRWFSILEAYKFCHQKYGWLRFVFWLSRSVFSWIVQLSSLGFPNGGLMVILPCYKVKHQLKSPGTAQQDILSPSVCTSAKTRYSTRWVNLQDSIEKASVKWHPLTFHRIFSTLQMVQIDAGVSTKICENAPNVPFFGTKFTEMRDRNEAAACKIKFAAWVLRHKMPSPQSWLVVAWPSLPGIRSQIPMGIWWPSHPMLVGPNKHPGVFF